MESVLSWASSSMMTCMCAAHQASAELPVCISPALGRMMGPSRHRYQLTGTCPVSQSSSGPCLVALQVWVYKRLAHQHAVCQITYSCVRAACVIKANIVANLHCMSGLYTLEVLVPICMSCSVGCHQTVRALLRQEEDGHVRAQLDVHFLRYTPCYRKGSNTPGLSHSNAASLQKVISQQGACNDWMPH